MQKRRTYRVGASTLSLEFGDITGSTADVLVSSDDTYLTMGGGVSAAIRRAAGQSILLDVAKKIPAKLGDVVVTSAGSLAAKHVFHAITLGDGDMPASEIVSAATRRSISLVRMLGLRSIAFPAIGTGVAGFSYQDVAVRMAEAIVEELSACSDVIEVTIYLFDRFGHMEPIDYIDFFEEVATRTRGLNNPSAAQSVTARLTVKATSSKRKSESKRTKALDDLAKLDREQQQLEGRLVQYGIALDAAEWKGINRRLKEIQDLRLALLSSVNPHPPGPVSVFISYSHADEQLRKQLGKHLSVLERQGMISMWHDRMIGPGTKWEGAIDERLNAAQIVLLLISASFMESKYCYDVEMTRALERHQREEALVIPVMLRPVSLKGSPFEKLQALPKDAKPVMKWPDKDSAYVDITDRLRDAIQDLVGAASHRDSRQTVRRSGTRPIKGS